MKHFLKEIIDVYSGVVMRCLPTWWNTALVGKSEFNFRKNNEKKRRNYLLYFVLYAVLYGYADLCKHQSLQHARG